MSASTAEAHSRVLAILGGLTLTGIPAVVAWSVVDAAAGTLPLRQWRMDAIRGVLVDAGVPNPEFGLLDELERICP